MRNHGNPCREFRASHAAGGDVRPTLIETSERGPDSSAAAVYREDDEAARRVRNYLSVLTMERRTLARACRKSHVHNLESEDMVALTVEAAAMAQVPLAETGWIPWRG